MLADSLLTKPYDLIDVRPCYDPIGLKLRHNHIVTDPTANHLNHLVKRHRTLRGYRPLWHSSWNHRRCPDNHRRLTNVTIGISLRLLLIVLLPLTLISLTFISLSLPLVTVPLVTDEPTGHGPNSTPNERPLGRLILVIVTNHTADDRPG
jgi:hypothetical protein